MSVLLISSTLSSIPANSATVVNPNLVSNPGLETVSELDASKPANWLADSWGANDATTTYVSDAHTGTKAVRTVITSYQDGDAKWLPDSVSVKTDTDYTYSDYYRATASTYLWVRFQMADGSYQYRHLQTLSPNASTWLPTRVSFKPPPNATQMVAFHVLSGVGQLDVDDVSLSENSVCQASYVNGLANGGFEESCQAPDGLPDGWAAEPGDGSSATFVTTAHAHSGTQAVTISNQADGVEAALSTNTTGLSAGQRYNLSFWQTGNTYVYAYLTLGLKNGSTTYQSLMSVPASPGSWSQYTDSFVTPADLQSLQITIATSGAGSIDLDDVVLKTLQNQIPATFNAGTLSLAFDDGAAGSYTSGFAALKTHGYKGTYYLNAAGINTPGFMTTAQVRTLAAQGQEIGSHLYHHSDMVQLDDTTLRAELASNKQVLQRIAGTQYAINDFASPYGSFTSGTVDTVMQYAQSHRNTDGQFNTKTNFDPRQIHAKVITINTTVATVQGWVAQAKRDRSWLVLVYHNISTSTAGEVGGEAGYTITPDLLKRQLSAIKSSGISVLPVRDALARLRKQL